MNNRINRNASPALTFLFSLLPGAGHMYLGLMRRGLEIMVVFFAAIFLVANTLGLAEIGVPLSIILFFYSLFDAQHLYKAVRKGEEVADTDFLKISSFTLNGYHMGIGAILLGFIFLLDRLRPYIVQFMQPAVYSMMQTKRIQIRRIQIRRMQIRRMQEKQKTQTRTADRTSKETEMKKGLQTRRNQSSAITAQKEKKQV